MKNNIRNTAVIFFSFIVLLSSCGKEASFQREPGEKPNKILQIESEAANGKSRVSINTPQVSDYIYTKIDFEIRPGVLRSVKLSKYESSILLEGFANAGRHKITLTPVSKGEVEGEKSTFEVDVLEPSYKIARKSLDPTFTFSGIRIKYENEEQDPLVINLATFHQDEKQIQTDMRKTINTKNGRENFLGLPSVENTFYFYVTDRWGNISDTLETKGTPWKEVEMNKNLFSEAKIDGQGDDLRYGSSWSMKNLWNNVKNSDQLWSAFYTKANIINVNNGQAATFAINFSKKAVLSRFKMHHYNGAYANYVFAGRTPKTFAVYGSNSPTNSTNLDSWELIGDFVSTKPANLTTAELANYGSINGEEFILEETPPAYQYYRFVIKTVWAGWTDLAIDELSFFGIYED